MNKVHMGKNKSLVSFANTKLIKINLSTLMVSESVRYCIIEKVNFVVKIHAEYEFSL